MEASGTDLLECLDTLDSLDGRSHELSVVLDGSVSLLLKLQSTILFTPNTKRKGVSFFFFFLSSSLLFDGH